MPSRKLFSVEEANALLPQIESLLLRLLRKKEMMDRRHDEFFMNELLQEAAPQRTAAASLSGLGAREVDEGLSELEADLAALRALGCILRNLDAGWVEFPANHQGQAIYLCWKKGESAIGFYRPTDAPFTARLPL